MDTKVLNSSVNEKSGHQESSTNIVGTCKTTRQRASEIFGVPQAFITPAHYTHAREQIFAENYGFRGVPLRSYHITESGVVEFI